MAVQPRPVQPLIGVGAAVQQPAVTDDGVDHAQLGAVWTEHGLAFGLERDHWSARLYADNLFDKYAVTSVRRDRSYIRRLGGPEGDQFASRTYFQGMLRPRTIGLEFNYRMKL